MSATVTAQWASGNRTAITDGRGAFSIRAPAGPVTPSVTSKYIARFQQTLAFEAPSQNLRLQVHYEIPKAHEILVICAITSPATTPLNNYTFKIDSTQSLGLKFSGRPQRFRFLQTSPAGPGFLRPA